MCQPTQSKANGVTSSNTTTASTDKTILTTVLPTTQPTTRTTTIPTLRNAVQSYIAEGNNHVHAVPSPKPFVFMVNYTGAVDDDEAVTTNSNINHTVKNSTPFEDFLDLIDFVKNDDNDSQNQQEDPVSALRKQFADMDTNNDGLLTRDELKAGLSARGWELTDDEVDGLFGREESTMNFSEFANLIAPVSDSEIASSSTSVLKTVFDTLDVNNDGVLSTNELKNGLDKFGINLTAQDITVLSEVVPSFAANRHSSGFSMTLEDLEAIVLR